MLKEKEHGLIPKYSERIAAASIPQLWNERNFIKMKMIGNGVTWFIAVVVVILNACGIFSPDWYKSIHVGGLACTLLTSFSFGRNQAKRVLCLDEIRRRK